MQASTMNLVQGKERNMNQNLSAEKDLNFNADKKKPVTLSIVQDFPKKNHASNNDDNVEMVQGKSKDVNFYDSEV